MSTSERHEVAEDGYVRDRAVMVAARGIEPGLDMFHPANRRVEIDTAARAIDALIAGGYTILAPPYRQKT